MTETDREPRPVPRKRDAAIVGAAAGLSVLGIWFVAYGTGIAPFPPYDLADFMIQEAPGSLATWGIETFGHWAQRSLMFVGAIGFIAMTITAAVLACRWITARNAMNAGLLAAVAVVALVWSVHGIPPGIGFIWEPLFFGATLGLAGRLAGRAIERLRRISVTTAERQQRSADWLDQPGDYARRELLRRALGTAALVGFGGVAGGWLLERSRFGVVTTEAGSDLEAIRARLDEESSEGETPLELADVDPLPPFIDDFPVPDAVRPRLTPNERFYTVDISTRDPNIPHESWFLKVEGQVDRELEISYAELLSLPAIELDGTLMCISYEYGTGLISTTRWTGVPLREVLRMAGIQDGAVDLALHGSGGYSDSIPVDVALQPRTLLAYAMDGEALAQEHGFPCRLFVPNLYGEKNVKWLKRIEVVDYDYRGFWQERGWTDEAIINILSVIDTPENSATPDADGIVPVAGIAFAGSRGISRVELRIDGDDWVDAEVEEYAPDLVWQRWRYDWPAQPGEHEITVRATDGQGEAQVTTPAPPHPDGMTGLQAISITVE